MNYQMHKSLISDIHDSWLPQTLPTSKMFSPPKRIPMLINIISYFPSHLQTPSSTYLLSLSAYLL